MSKYVYIIGEETVEFDTEQEMLEQVALAEEKGLYVEPVSDPEDGDTAEVSKAPESAFSQVISGEVPEVEEDFTQDPVESADAVSKTVAQEDTELLLDDGSTELPSGEDYSIDGKPVTKKEYEIYDAEVKADKPLELTLSEEDFTANEKKWEEEFKKGELPPPPDWDLAGRTWTGLKETTKEIGALATTLPTYLNQFIGAVDRAVFMDDAEKEVFDSLDPKVRAAILNVRTPGILGNLPGSQNLANQGLLYYEEASKEIEKVRSNMVQFETTIGEEYARGNFVEATARTISDAIISLPTMAQAMIPYVGIASIVLSQGSKANMEAQEEGKLLDLKTMAYSGVIGASEGLLELVSKKIGGGMFRSLTGKSRPVIKQAVKDVFLKVAKDYNKEGLSEEGTFIINSIAEKIYLGSEKEAIDYFKEGLDTYLIGGMSGGGVSSVGSSANVYNQIIDGRKIKAQLNETDYTDLSNAYKTTEVPDGLVNLSLNPSVQAFLNKELDVKLKKGDITIEESNNIKRNFADTQGAAKAVNASTISDTNAGEAVELLTEKTRLEADIKTIGDKSLSGPQQLRVDTIKTLLKKLAGQGVLDAKTKKADAILKQLGGKGVVEVGNEKQMAAKFDQINKEDQKLHDDAQQKAIEAGEKTFKVGETEFSVDSQYKSNAQEFGGYGTYVPRLDGTAEVIINKAVAFEDGMVNTAAHEVLHYALRETLKSTVAQKKTGTALLDFVNSIETTEDIKDNEFTRRLKQYKDDARITEGDTQEEVLTLLSEAMLDGKLKFNETMSTKLLDFGRRLLSSMGFASVEFNTGKDVFNFIKDYNRSINKGKLDKGLAGSLKKGIKGRLTDSTIKDQPKKKQSVKPSLITNKVDTALAALEEAEALRDEDFDNPTLAANVEKAEAAYDQALIEAENLEEDAAVDVAEEATKEKIVRPKADKTKRRYSLDADVKKEIEPQIAEAQALNKELIAQEKELNKKAIADIEAIPDKEVKRTEKDKRIAELKTNPLRVSKSNELNKLEREISKELKTPIDKAVNLFTKLYYDKISDNAKTAVTRDEFKESARAEITSITINEFKPKTINRQGESVVNDIEDIIFQRGGLRLRSLAERLGVVGRDQGVARGAEALIKMADSSSDINFDENDKDSVKSEEKRKVSALLASEARYNQAREQVVDFWKENEGNTKVENFKKVPNLINNILSEMFNVTEGTLTARSGNLNKADYANAIKAFTEKQAVFTVKEGDTKKEVRVPVSEVSAFQDGLNEKKADNKDFSYKREANESIAEALLRFLPQTSADDYTYASGRKGRFSGKSTGLPKNLMGLAYKIEGRKTTGIGNVERTAQKLTIEEIYDAIGAGFDADGNVVQKMGLSGKNKEGQTMIGLIKLLGRMVTNEISRTETDLDPMTKMDIAAGKNRQMFSKRKKKLVNALSSALGVDVDISLSEKAVNNTRNLFKEIGNELGPKETVKYIVPLVSKGYGKLFYTKNGKPLFKPGRETPFKNRADLFEVLGDEDFKKFQPRDREIEIEGENVILKISFNQSAKNLEKFVNQIESRKDFAKDQRKGLNKIAKILRSKLQEDFEGNKDAVASVLQAMNSNVNALIRTAAIPELMALEVNSTEYIYEHSKTASDTMVELALLIFDSNTNINFDERFKEIMEDFIVSIIPAPYDKALNEVSRSNGPRQGDSKGDYTKPLIKSKNGIPARYTYSEFVSKLIEKGLAPMNLVPINKEELKAHFNSVKSSKKLIDENTKLLPKNLRQEGITNNQAIENAENFDKAINLGNSLDKPTKGISVWDFDDTLATTKSNVLYTMPDGTKGKLDASRFAKEGDTFLANGAEFDFSEFSKVMNGDKGPFFNKAVDRNRKFGNKDVYILTARPANSANAIHEFLKGIGLDIPLANITGLASSDPQAKANWVVGKFAEGYNDFYFADDHVGNVAAVGDALSRLDDVRSKVELAKAAKYSKKIRREYSAILLKTRGDLVVGNVLSSPEGQINAVFDWAKTLDIPEKNIAKYKRAALNFIAKSDTNFPMDIEIVDQAMKIVEAKKLDAMSFANPRTIIDEFADGVKEKRLDPNKEKQFFNKKSLPEGVETFEIMPSPAGQKAVRRMVDTHWGEKTNPWCVTAQEATYTAAEEKQRKENNPRFPIGVIDQVLREVLIENGVTNYEAHPLDKDSDYQDFLGNLKPGWIEVERKDAIRPFNEDDIIMLDADNQKDYDEFLAMYTKMGYRIVEDLTYEGQPEFLFRMHRNDNPETDKVIKTTRVYQLKDPNMTLDEFMKGPAKGGTVFNPEIEPTGPAELSGQSSALWKDYAVNTTDAGYEIAFKDGKLLGLKNLGGLKQQWFDRMDNATKDLALKVPRDGYGKINGASTMMKTDTGRVYSAVTPKAKYSKRLDKEINFLTNELSTKGEALQGQSTNLEAQLKAVKDVINTLDIKSKVQQARVKSSLQLSKRFNEIIEEESGIEAFKEYQSVKAAKKGAKKGKFKFFVPPSAEDFLGLLYTTLPKGKKGESAMAFYKEHLLDPYGKAVTGLRTGRITIAKNYKALKKELGIVPRTLKKNFKYEDENGNMKESLFTKEDAIRVYTWDAQGFDIPGLSNVDLPILVNYVNSNPDLKAFADKLLGLNKNVDPKAPTESWPAGTITSDLLNTLNTDGRKQLLEVWQQNVDAIFTSTNLNKLEAAYGKPYVTALKDSLRRMRTGRNSTPTNNGVTDGIVRWLNAAVGNIMFLNRRSAVLQLISFTNFINFEGNNLYQAGKAFANQPQYWKDWVYLMNSDYLVDRRDGLKINVNEADIATTAKENGFQGVLAKILQLGFIPTKMADSAAIATGGASFYRNRVNALIKGGMSKAAAEKQAMQDFITTAEVSQQSSDPSKISKQQAEPIGRIILAFANTPSQYARIIKRAAQDLKNGRGDAKTHLSRIVYYGALQNVVFNFLQQAMFAAMMGDDEDESEEDTAAKSANKTKKAIKVANSMTDGILRGIGVAGAVVSVAKNLAIKLYERSQKTRNQNLAATIKDEVMKISPPISSKLSKAGKVGNAFEWGKKEIEFDEMSLKHPYVTAATNTVAALTGLPLDRAQGMAIDAVDIASDETETWMKPLIALGWPKWQLMSEEATEKEREEKKERFKDLEKDKEFQKLNPLEQRRKVLKDLKKDQQIDSLWNMGLSKTEIRKLKKEDDRVDKIISLQDKRDFFKDLEAEESQKEKRKNSLK